MHSIHSRPKGGNGGARADSIASLKATLDLVELAGKYVPLKRSGRVLWGCCPFHDDSTPSFKVDPERQRYHCFGCGADGDEIDFKVRIEGVGLRELLARQERAGARQDAPPPAPAPKPPRTYKRFEDGAEALWRAAQVIEPGDVASVYLPGRGCALPHPEGDLRLLPRHPHPDGWCGPALVARITDAITAEPISLHRTWLALDGRGKAPIKRQRLLLKDHRKAGGVVRLWPDAEVTLGLCLAEGVETALSAARGYGLAWATLDTGNLRTFPVLDGIEALTIVEDRDAAGIAAAAECARRWIEAGREVRTWQASTAKTDFNDFATGSAR